MRPSSIQQNVPLAPLTTMRVGGAARFFSRAESLEAVRDTLIWGREQALPVLILGGGSNLVVPDRGFDGLVIEIATRGISFDTANGITHVVASAGEVWDELVKACVSRDLAGVECLSGIPGRVGATPIQNVGAYGQDVSETIVSVEALHRESLERVTFTADDCRFSYRQSRFKQEDRDRYVITSVTFALSPGGAPAIRYPDLQRELEASGSREPTLSDVREAVIAVRRRKGMVLDPRDHDTWSCGSFFMNPLVSEKQLEEVRRRAAGHGSDPAAFPVFGAGEPFKLSAAWLIEHSGFPKGYRIGNAATSTKHTLALTNRGSASAEEIVTLMRTIQRGVEEKFGVVLEPEPNLLS